MNNLNFTGNIGNDAETRFTADDKAITSWSVAMQSGYGKSEKTNWVRCSMFGDRGEKLAKFLLKGTQVAVSGEASLNEYTNKAGENKASIQCVVSNVTLLGKKDSKPAEKVTTTDSLDELESDIPFS
jgi:single-strand DNA-binding protein